MASRLPDDLPADIESPSERGLGDFTMSIEALRLVPLALVIGVAATIIAVVLVALIGLFTNLLYEQRLDWTFAPPDPGHLGLLSIGVPIVGGLVIGVMARFGSERIRGHGIPEAMETILVGGSRVEPRLAILKPISSAISIGSGGPFGAEGPIILTGGAVGSIIGQLFHLSAAERKTLLVSGASAGMTAVFGTPVAAVILAAELLLFEWKPRSLLPVAAACALAAMLRIELTGAGVLAAAPLFPVPEHPILGLGALLGSLLVGLVGGVVAWVLTAAVYGAEDLFSRLPIHWMWWPAIGGVVVGIGGLIEPRALGVGYESIRAELAGELALGALVTLLVVKLVIWAVALGSGTSGGILAPLLILGGASGAIVGQWLPSAGPAVWAMLGMAAALAGVTRSPLTALVFALELTHDQNALLPLLVVCMTAYAISVLALRRSILTEKVARRGYHVMREYAVDPLEALLVRDVMNTNLLTTEPERRIDELAALADDGRHRRQRLYPVVNPDRGLVGVVGRREVASALLSPPGPEPMTVAGLMRSPVVAYPDETLRAAAERMAATRLGVLPVVARNDGGELRGLVSQFDLLRARDRLLAEERHRERVLRLRALPSIRRPGARQD
ncbi:MAG TPA: chloride channel protein [Candidatus Limnocylindrales bacterium]|nr:chloride channel protein [Candidatus Limnocylindrales bacterium]